jgi:hypothetical protein
MQRPKPERGGFELEIGKQEESFAWSRKDISLALIYKIKTWIIKEYMIKL